MQAGLKNMSAACGRHIVLAHGKDVRLKPDGKVEWLTAGKGVLDYATFTSLLDKLGREIFLSLEYLKEPEVPQVKSYVERYLKG
jgi:sugar phosphate isomerase/epimerase